MATKRKPGSRRIARAIAITLGCLVLLEFTLQLASYVAFVAISRNEVTTGAEGGSTILCVGDSYTYGVGAGSPEATYPAVMGRLVEEKTGVKPTVVNAGWPGLNSRDLLSRIDGQLERFKPDVVFILVGLNDGWSQPALLTLDPNAADAADAPGSHWQWRWRTRRLLLWGLAGGKPFGSDAPPQPAPAPPAPSRPEEENDDFRRAFRLLSEGDHEAAAAAFEDVLVSQPERAAEARQGLAQTYTMLGEADKARASLAWLEQEHAKDPSRATTEALTAALVVLRENARAFDVAAAGLEKYPESSQLWWFQGQEQYRRGDLASAEKAYQRALDRARPEDQVWRAVVMRDLAQSCAERDPKKALQLVVSSYLIDQNMGTSLVALEAGKVHFTPELGRQSLAEMGLNEESTRAGQALLDTWFSKRGAPPETDATGQVLESHVRQMIARCEARGAKVVLLTYPMTAPQVEALVAKLAREGSVGHVEMRPLLEAAKRADPEAVLFVPDGHCADAGYEIMGRAAADAAVLALGVRSGEPEAGSRP